MFTGRCGIGWALLVENQGKSLPDLVRALDRYPEEAFLFVREALSFTAEKVHGQENEAHRFLQHFLVANQLDWSELIARYHTGELPENIQEAIEAAGGSENLNRHIGGNDLCWGLRDYALERWGLLARTVLESWNITGTEDFGRIVFGFIDFDMMQKEDDDCLADFRDIYAFDEALDKGYRIGPKKRKNDPSES